MLSELSAFLDGWTKDSNAIKPVFTAMYEHLRTQDGVSFDYKGRPGVSHSLRARHKAQNDRDCFVFIDIIDDEPEARWLSVCFYADLVTDPEGRGDVVPGGLMGEDAHCFDIDSPEAEGYMLARLQEAMLLCQR